MVTFRSEPMLHGTVVLPADHSHELIDCLGRETHMQFIDMNSTSLKRSYRRYIQRLDEMERILRFLFDEIGKLQGAHIEKGHIQEFLENDHFYKLEAVEDSLQKLYSQFVRFRSNNADLLKEKNAALEAKAVSLTCMASFGTSLGRRAAAGLSRTTPPPRDEGVGLLRDVEFHMSFASIAGVVAQENQLKLQRSIYRVTRGNSFVHVEPTEGFFMNGEGQEVKKSVFVVYFQGTPGSAMFEKINRICQAYGVSIYDWPRNYSEAAQQVAALENTAQDKSRALVAYEDYFTQEISQLLEVTRPNGNALIEEWRLFCVKQRAVFATLDMFEPMGETLRCDCWFPNAEEETIRNLLKQRSASSLAFLISDTVSREAPPTYFRTTEFTSVFQGFVDTYGIARYREANPALLTIMTFPFLFGIMYGDIGHGICVLLFGLYLIFSHERLKRMEDELVGMMSNGRYMILLMGIFATFAGFMYNDFFSIGLDIFGSRYVASTSAPSVDAVPFEPDTSQSFPYPFGFDPVWKGASNELAFFNSFKMKFAVIVAGVQMGVGVLLKAMNTLYFRDHLSFVFEFLPQILFFSALIGYMDFLIVWKWFSSADEKPNIITTIISMCMLKPPEVEMFRGQEIVQYILVAIMLVTVPLMLLPKPLILKSLHDKQVKADTAHEDEARYSGAMMEEGGEVCLDHHEFDFSEEFIHQLIETIEFVLGSISNTASYLRLWALSLAHQQLSLVFFEKSVLAVLEMQLPVVAGALAVFLAFGFFALATFGVMMCMDTLECFLHALRLQWVEFQSKFFKADGHRFRPFEFQRMLLGLDEE